VYTVSDKDESMEYLSMHLPELKFGRKDVNVQAYEQALTSWTDDVPTCRLVFGVIPRIFFLLQLFPLLFR